MLPRQEIRILTTAVDRAAELAARGRRADGYEALRAGLRRATEIYVTSAFHGGELEAYGDELVERWRVALDRYVRRFGIAALS